MESCPRDLKPYDIAHKKKTDEENYFLWLNGLYVAKAIMATIGNSTWFKSRGTPANEYPDGPININIGTDQDNRDDENDKAVKEFYAQEAIRRANWNRTHHKQQIENTAP